MGLKSKNYNKKIKHKMDEDKREITELFHEIVYHTKRLKNISNVIYLILIINLCQTLLFNPFLTIIRRGYFGEFGMILLFSIASIFSLIGIFCIYIFDRIKRRGMIRYEILINFIEKKVKLNEGGEENMPFEARIILKDFLNSCNLIFSNSSIGLLIYLLIFIFNMSFNTFLFISTFSMF